VSLQARIINLISGITDPALRIDVASTINYLFTVFSDGTINETEARNSVREVCMNVISVIYPEFTEEEVRRRVDTMVEEFMRAFKLESTVRRMFGRYRPRYGLPM